MHVPQRGRSVNHRTADMTTAPIHTTDGCPYPWCVTPHRDVAHDDDHHARQAVDIARQRLDHVRRMRMRGQAGNADVVAAEHQLDQALDRWRP